jgi:molybdenum cofactor synthesis domain-containing protein
MATLKFLSWVVSKLVPLKQPFSYIYVSEAWEKISNANISLLGSELIPTSEALGRTLSRDIVSPIRLPGNDLAHYDGYAIRSMDTVDADVNPVLLHVVDKAYPDQPARITVGEREACYITTGSPLPNGADSILAMEMARSVGDSQIQVRERVTHGEHVTHAGTDVKEGEVVIPRGKKLRFQDIILLSLLKVETVEVCKKPMVSILSIGDELVGRVNTHSLLLCHWVQLYGGVPIDLGIARDNITEIKNRVKEAVTKTDVLLTIGGCSMGEKDLVGDALRSVGKPGLILHGLKVKPGRVSGFGVLMGKPIIMLPGLIQSTVVGFYFLVLPLLQHIRRLPLTSAWNV